MKVVSQAMVWSGVRGRVGRAVQPINNTTCLSKCFYNGRSSPWGEMVSVVVITVLVRRSRCSLRDGHPGKRRRGAIF